MSFSVNRRSLLNELAVIGSVIERKGTIPVLSTLRIDATDSGLTLIATDLDKYLVSTALDAQGKDSYCLSFDRLYAAVKLFDSDDVQFKQQANERVEVKGGSSRHLLASTPIDQYPVIEMAQGNALTLDSEGLRVSLERALRCVDHQSGSRWASQGVCFDASERALRLVSCDGAHLSVSELPQRFDDLRPFKFVLPTAAVSPLIKLLAHSSSVDLIATESQAGFYTPTRKLTCRLLVGQIINWEMIIPSANNYEVRIPAEMTNALRRCAITAESGNLVRKPLKMGIFRDRIELESYTGDEQSSETLTAECAGLNGEPVVIKINGDQIASYLKTAEKPVLHFKDERTQMLFTDESDAGYRYVNMPLRPDA